MAKFQKKKNIAGEDSFIWNGPTPRVIITDPELVKDVFNKIDDFPKPHTNPLVLFLTAGLAEYEGEKWVKHRKIISPAFHMEKVKVLIFFHLQVRKRSWRLIFAASCLVYDLETERKTFLRKNM